MTIAVLGAGIAVLRYVTAAAPKMAVVLVLIVLAIGFSSSPR